MKIKVKYGAGALLVLVIFLGYGFKSNTDNTQKYDTISKLSSFNDTGITGAELFKKNCSACHGIDRQGNLPTFPSLVNIDKKLKKNEIAFLLTTGRNMMPNFSHLSESERVAIIGYLYGENTVSEHITELSSVETGKNIFIANCARCHQTIPTDKIPPDQKRMGRKPPALGGIAYKYNENQFKKILNTGPMYMPSFIALTNKEKEEIYTYLNSIDVNSNFLQPKKRRGCNMKN